MVKVIKSRKMGWEGHVARMGTMHIKSAWPTSLESTT